jgi:predicted Na+-dependent transporter
VSIGRLPRLPIDALVGCCRYAAFSVGVTEHIFAVVLVFCGSKKIMLPLMVFHMTQLLVCAAIAGQPAREVSYG